MNAVNNFMEQIPNIDDIKINFVGQLALSIIVFVLVIWIFGYVFSYTRRFIKTYKGTVKILPGFKNADTSYFISNNPNDNSYMKLPRAYNEDKGVTFTYNFWMLIDKWSIRQGQLKHVFNKGNALQVNSDSDKDFDVPLLNAPGCYLDRTDNKLFVVMNTYNNPGRKGTDKDKYKDETEALTVDNIPINKWIAITIMLDGQILSVYKNGYLQKTVTLKDYPRQNSSPLRINEGDGYSGYISKLTYYNYPISQSEIESYVNSGPTDSNCIKGKDIPSYMSTTYIENLENN